MIRTLRLAKDLALPLDAVTQTFAILAKRRAGKSYLMRRLVEQLFHAGQQVVLVDPKGDQWGVRSAANGKDPGLPIIILGGERGDVPLEPTGGEVVAKLIVEERVSVLLDLSTFRKHEVATFMGAFLESLYRLKAREEFRTPLMLVIDEADAIAPQKPYKGEERMLGAAEDIVRRGGQRGIGCVLVSQRSAVLNKNVLTQAQILIAMRTIAPQDLAAMNAWIDVHGTEDQKRTLMASLPALPVGDAWVWSPGWPTVDGVFQRVHVLPIETFDSGATPKAGEKRVEPKRPADVDLGALKRQMAATIEKAKADDPRELRRTIAELRKQITQRAIPDPKEKMTIREIPALKARDTARLVKAADRLAGVLEGKAGQLLRDLQIVVGGIRASLESFEKAQAVARGGSHVSGVSYAADRPIVSVGSRPRHSLGSAPVETQRRGSTTRDRGRDRAAWDQNGDDAAIVKGGKFRAMMVALAQAGRPLTEAQLATRAGMAVSGTFDTYLGRMRRHGWIHGSRQGLAITADGLAALGDWQPLPRGAALRAYWLEHVGTGKQREMLTSLIAAYPDTLTEEEVANRAMMAVSGTFDTYLGRLRRLQLIEGTRRALKAADELFEE